MLDAAVSVTVLADVDADEGRRDGASGAAVVAAAAAAGAATAVMNVRSVSGGEPAGDADAVTRIEAEIATEEDNIRRTTTPAYRAPEVTGMTLSEFSKMTRTMMPKPSVNS